MEVTLEKIDKFTASITVKISETDYTDKVNNALKEHAKKANMKGFRPGKVPVNLIKKMYGKSVLADTVLQAAENTLKHYIVEKEIKLIAQPLFDDKNLPEIDWDTQKEFTFTYEIGLEPEIDVQSFVHNLGQFTERKIEIPEQDLDEYIEELQRQYGEYPQAEESQPNDVLMGKFIQGEHFSEAVRFNVQEVAENERDKFIGIKKDAVVTFDLRAAFPEDSKIKTLNNNENVSDLKGEFTFELHNISRAIPAQINQDFFDKVFGENVVTDEAQFRSKVREASQKYYDVHSRNLLIMDFHKAVNEQLNPEFPDDFARRWLLSNESITQDNLEENFLQFKNSLIWELALRKAFADHNIEQIEEEAFIKHIKDQLFVQYYNMNVLHLEDSFMDMLVQQYMHNTENQEDLRMIFNMLKIGRLFNIFKDSLEIQTVEMTRKEFEDFSREAWEKAEAENDTLQIVEEMEEVIEA